MELYHNNMSVCSQKVRLVLREKKQTPIEHHLNLRAGDQTQTAYLLLNPNGVVPTIVDEGLPIVESTVICEYLDDAYPDPPIRPKSSKQRADMRVWTLLPDAGLHGACTSVSFAIAFRHQFLCLGSDEIERKLALKADPVGRERQRRGIYEGLDAPGVADALRFYNKVLTRIEEQLRTERWLAGDEYSLADAAMLPYVFRLENLALAWLWADNRKATSAWLDRCKARGNFSAISEYIDAQYMAIMESSGREAVHKVKTLLSQ